MLETMNTGIDELKNNVALINDDIHILLVGGSQTRKLKKSLELKSESVIVSEANDDTEIEAMVGIELPDVIVAITDGGKSPAIFNQTLLTLCRLEMNARTIIVSENPFQFLGCALKSKVAALLCRKIDPLDLLSIIKEVRAWSHGQPISSSIFSRDIQPGHETEPGGA
jgi:hypothetical protein